MITFGKRFGREDLIVTSGEGLDRFEKGQRMLDRSISQQPRNSTRIERRIEQARGQQSPISPAKMNSAGNFRDIDWLDPNGVARQHQALAGNIVIRKSEHPLEAENCCLGAPEGQGVQEHFSVAMALKTDALRFQLAAQHLKVVDFAVEDENP